MKGSKSLIAITIAATLALAPSAIAAPKTTSKAAGRVTTIVNTILSGAGIPTKTIGINGDFYIDTKNLYLYGPKIKGAWKTGTSLKQADTKSVTTVTGEVGATGDKGAQGEKGDKGATGSTGATGSAGLPGAAGAAGAKGSDGVAGLSGSPGPAGTQGAAGASGTAGASGAQGAQGIKGDAGVAGAVGAQGVQGVKGDTGVVGASGAAGISASFFVDLGTWTLGTNQNVGTSDSNTFGNLDAGFYTFEIMIDGTFSPNTITDMTIGMQLITSAGTLDYRVFASDSAAYINGYGNRHYQFMIIGKLICTGATTLKLRAVDQYGATANNLLNFSGRALINKVGSIG
ncbi:MAG: collagen-like protein [Candidatus Planktophila sp.]|nr:collagen-like protein [Candidatus Planktophila sp.]